jgi:RNAse (barnase) inhibitor barstar
MSAVVLTLEGSNVTGISAFYAEINRVFMAQEPWQLGESLDALDDLLHGNYGALAGHPSATVIWKDLADSRAALGVDTTRAWLQAKLERPELFNIRAITTQLQALEQGGGRTYFDIVLDVFAAHPTVQVVAA